MIRSTDTETRHASFRSALLHCRAGFEGECSAEAIDLAGSFGGGYCRTAPTSALVEFVPADHRHTAELIGVLTPQRLCFARQISWVIAELDELSPADRLTPLMRSIQTSGLRFGAVRLEHPDSDEHKTMATFCRKFDKPFGKALRDAALITERDSTVLHICFVGSARAYVSVSVPPHVPDWPMGIPRLKFPPSAPSRSTLKLDEALHVFLTEQERTELLQPGMLAVDLGAAPGGWTYQLVRRHIRVVAVDNANVDRSLLESGLVTHERADGFTYRPKKPVDWMVCDMVEQPSRIAELVGRWVAENRCSNSIFNLKLPMKRRYQELLRCKAIIEDALNARGLTYRLAFKQLYHDRAEVTGCLLKEKGRFRAAEKSTLGHASGTRKDKFN